MHKQDSFSATAKHPNFSNTTNVCAPANKCRRVPKWAHEALKALMFGLLSLLVLYWQSTGQMLSSAAQPSVYACAVLMGMRLRASCESFKKR